MKRIIIAGLIAFVVVIATIALLTSGNRGSAPKFVPGTPAKIAPSGDNIYLSSADVPFPNGTLWVFSADTNHTKGAVYLYHLDHRVILGELFNGGVPILQNRDASRILLEGPPTLTPTPLQNVLVRLGRIFGTRFSSRPRATYNLLILDTKSNSARRLFSGVYLDSWRPSPDSRYGFSVSHASLYTCDLETRQITGTKISGNPLGWWSDEEIVIQNHPEDFVLFNIKTRQFRTLLTDGQIDKFLTQNGVPVGPWQVQAFSNWNGHDYDFYLALLTSSRHFSQEDSYLLKIDRSGPSLKLLYPHFKFQSDGVLDVSATHYLYSGEPGGLGSGGDGSICLRDLSSGQTTILVPPDDEVSAEQTTALVPPGSGRHYSYPRFFGDEVIYFRNRVLHRIKFDGSGDEPVLPQAK